jgi:hypothetical protein
MYYTAPSLNVELEAYEIWTLKLSGQTNKHEAYQF